MSEKLVTPKQVARAIGASESSVKRWCDRGLIPMVRTAGGHRRLPISGVLRFLRQGQRPLVRPEILDLPATTGKGVRVVERSLQRFLDTLVRGDVVGCTQIVFDLYLAGHPVADICDQVFAAAFHEVGDRWQCGDIGIYHERRACGLCTRLLHDLRSVAEQPAAGGPVAIGGTPEGDPYSLATQMIELVLREAGWHAVSLGSSLPMDSLLSAVQDYTPKLFWLSVSDFPDAERFVEQLRHFQKSVVGDTAIAVGGRALTEDVRSRIRNVTYCRSMSELAAFADSLTGQRHFGQS